MHETAGGSMLRLERLAKQRKKLESGTKSAKGQAFTCVLTGSPIERDYIQAEGKADRLSARLMVVVAEKNRKRIFLPPDQAHEAITSSINNDPIVSDARAGFLSATTPTRAMITGGVCSAYGLRTWGHLFTSRQIVALSTFADLVVEAREQILRDAAHDDLNASVYADAVATYLGLGVGRLSDIQNALCRWEASKTQVRNLFSRQGMGMIWDFAENNLFNDAAGDYATSLENLVKAMGAAPAIGSGIIEQRDATKGEYPVLPVVISTDPPYYDNIAYAILSDFFYVCPSALIVRAEVALEHLRRETKGSQADRSQDDDGGKQVPPPPSKPTKPHRFYGSVEIDMVRPVKSFDAILNAVILQLQRTPGAKVKVTLEIEAKAPSGFDHSEVGIVRDNATQLKFTRGSNRASIDE